jgi:hypothetical protein
MHGHLAHILLAMKILGWLYPQCPDGGSSSFLRRKQFYIEFKAGSLFSMPTK